jgi:hypothetical protein
MTDRHVPFPPVPAPSSSPELGPVVARDRTPLAASVLLLLLGAGIAAAGVAAFRDGGRVTGVIGIVFGVAMLCFGALALTVRLTIFQSGVRRTHLLSSRTVLFEDVRTFTYQPTEPHKAVLSLLPRQGRPFHITASQREPGGYLTPLRDRLTRHLKNAMRAQLDLDGDVQWIVAGTGLNAQRAPEVRLTRDHLVLAGRQTKTFPLIEVTARLEEGMLVLRDAAERELFSTFEHTENVYPGLALFTELKG